MKKSDNPNPFKFGTVVDGEYFTDREDELESIISFLRSRNHLILISPRRYGKTSLIKKVLNETGKVNLFVDMQLVLSPEDFASQLLKRIYQIWPVQKLKNHIKTFRIIPGVSINPVTGQTDITFQPITGQMTPLEDVLNMTEKLGEKNKKVIIVLDEFQEIFRISSGLDRFLRSVMQNHKNINYVFLGSSESMIREIFEKKSSPFYRFGSLMALQRIKKEKFISFLEDRFKKLTKEYVSLSDEILKVTDCHPFYTQQLSFTVWDRILRKGFSEDVVIRSSEEIVQSHDNDYERIWNSFNRTDMSVLTGIALFDIPPLSEEFSRNFGAGASSTVYSSLQRLTNKGMLIKEDSTYRFDDPFFRKWIIIRRQG